MWLVVIGDLPEKGLNLTYSFFWNKYYLFSDNGQAVDSIREMMETNGFKERWIDVAWDSNHEEYVTYLFFKKGKYELGVWFYNRDVDEI